MINVEIILKDRSLLLEILKKVTTDDLSNEMSTRKDVSALFQDGAKVFMIKSNKSQTA